MIQHPEPTATQGRDHRVWEIRQMILGVVLFVLAAGVLALYFLQPHFLPDEKKLHDLLRGADEKSSTGIFLLLVTLGTQALFFMQRMRGARGVLGLVLGGLVVVGLAGNMLPQKTLWGWVFAALPAMLVVHHGLYLGLMKPRILSREMLEGKEGGALGKANFKELVEAQDRYFNANNIALRYGLPALAIFTIGAVIFHGLTPITEWSLDKMLREEIANGFSQDWITYPTMEAARLGAAGAYVYVLLYLGQRGFRHDITSGAALWCAVTLALGPLMAAALSKIWVGGTGNEAVPTGWATQALYFGIGMSPRHVAQAVARVAQRMMSDTTKFVPPERTTPLGMIRGITPQIEERLAEEGVHDVVGMAMADPLRLQRGTNFDKHQILGWIDMAILAHALPESWQYLEKKGLRGARDLTWYVSEPTQDKVEGLAKLVPENLNVVVLRNVAQRLAQDAQAQRILLLYQLVGEAGALQDDLKPPSDSPMAASTQLSTSIQRFPPAEATDSPGTPAVTPEAAATQASEAPQASTPPKAQG